MDEEIVSYLRRKLREAGGPSEWEAIATKTGVAKSLPRKIAYGDRLNPGVEKIQPLLTYFRSREAEPAKV